MTRQLILGLILATALAAPSAPAQARAPEKPVEMGAEVRTDPAFAVAPFSFRAPTGNLVTGEIVRPTRRGAHPGVLFVHWLGDPKTTNHTEFEADAAALARHGVTSVLVDTMWSRPGWVPSVGKSASADAKATQDQVAELRAALDLLLAQPGVQPRHVAVVGHDFGAMLAALMAGVDPRPQAYVLMAGNSDLAEWYTFGKVVPAEYARDLGLSVTGALKASRTRAFLFQFAEHDRYIPADRAAAFVAAAPVAAKVMTYPTDHSLALPQAFEDRQAWLLAQLTGGR